MPGGMSPGVPDPTACRHGLVAINETRIVAGLYARVPETVLLLLLLLLLLLVGSALSLGMVGYMQA